MEFPASPGSFYCSEEGKTHYRYIENEGAPTVCILPGFSLPSAIFSTFSEKLSKLGFSVLVMDYYGRGYSEPKECDDPKEIRFSPNIFARQFIQLIKKLDIDKCEMIAFSFGALVASHVTSLEPDLITHLVLISPFKYLKNPTRPFQRLVLTPQSIGPWILSTFSAQFVPYEIKTQINAEANPDIFWGLVSSTMCEINANKSYFVATSQMLGSLDEDFIDSELVMLRQIPFKTLVVFGSNDATIDIAKSAVWWQETLLNGKIVNIANAGHLCFLEQPDAVMDAVAQFISK